MTETTTDLRIPDELKPLDGRFGSGPSRVRREQLDYVVGPGSALIGTSHRQKPVRQLVGRIRAGITDLLSLPDGYEVLLGNGGTTAFWDAATCCLIRERSLHLTYGEFSSKFAACTRAAPFLRKPVTVAAEPGDAPTPGEDLGSEPFDAIAWAHNETSTGVMVPVTRPQGTDGALVLIDATSGAGGLPLTAADADVYYFAPQKGFASDGGLWLAAMSPAAIARIDELAAGDDGRWVPDFLSLPTALENSRKDQTYNTPAIVTLLLLDSQLGGCSTRAASTRWCGAPRPAARTCTSGPWPTPTRRRSCPIRPSARSWWARSTSTMASMPRHWRRRCAPTGSSTSSPTASSGATKLRVAMFPATDPADVQALTACIDWVLERS